MCECIEHTLLYLEAMIIHPRSVDSLKFFKFSVQTLFHASKILHKYTFFSSVNLTYMMHPVQTIFRQFWLGFFIFRLAR